jgi:hypothetical protein
MVILGSVLFGGLCLVTLWTICAILLGDDPTRIPPFVPQASQPADAMIAIVVYNVALAIPASLLAMHLRMRALCLVGSSTGCGAVLLGFALWAW